MDDFIRYRSRPSDEQVENLRAFTRYGERTDPISFVGREDYLDHITTLIQDKRQDSSLQSITQLVQGAPGAGKTSLLNELDRVNRGDHVTVVRLDGEDLSEPLVVAEEFIASIGANARDIGESSTRTQRTTGDIKIAQHQLGRETHTASALERIERGASMWRSLTPLLDVDANHVFLLLVDEAQRVDKTRGKDINEAVTSLHTGGYATANLRILPVFAGLSDTSERLEKVGLTRNAVSPHRLGALSRDEAQEAAEGFMEDERIGIHDVFPHFTRTDLARTFAVASEGWPRHLHNYLTGLAIELVHDCDRPQPNGGVSVAAVLAYGHEQRCNYYDDRLQSADLGFVEDALVALSLKGGTPATLNGDEIAKHVADTHPQEADLVREKIALAVHAGVLERRSDLGRREYSYPIPSFATYMANECSRKRTLTQMQATLETRMQSLEKEERNREHGLER